MAKNIIIDTGFWYALYNITDQNHKSASSLAGNLDIHKLLIPWPSLYETLNTQFVRQLKWLSAFEALMGRQNVVKLEDTEYRKSVLKSVFHINKRGRSAVDPKGWTA